MKPADVHKMGPFRWNLFLLLLLLLLFLYAPSHLYKRVCPSVRQSVRMSVGPSVSIQGNAVYRILGASYVGYPALLALVLPRHSALYALYQGSPYSVTWYVMIWYGMENKSNSPHCYDMIIVKLPLKIKFSLKILDKKASELNDGLKNKNDCFLC